MRRYFVVFLIALFAGGSIVTSAMAHCVDASSNQDVASIPVLSPAEGEGATDNAPGGGAHHHSTANNGSDSTNCYDCNGNLCQTQSLAPVHASLNLLDSSGTNHVETDSLLKPIFLANTTEPPKQLS